MGPELRVAGLEAWANSVMLKACSYRCGLVTHTGAGVRGWVSSGMAEAVR